MILGGVLAVFIPFAIVGTVTTVILSDSLQSLSGEKNLQIARDMAELVQTALSQEMKFIAALSVDRDLVESLSTGNYLLSNQMLSRVFSTVGNDYEDIILINMHGVTCSTGKANVGIDVSDRDYFIAAKGGKIYVGTPVRSRLSGGPILGVCSPVKDAHGNIIGAIASIVKTDFFVKRILPTKIGSTGYPFMIDSTGLVIAHPVQSHILVTNGHNTDGVKTLISRMVSQQYGTEKYTFQGVKKIGGFAPIPMTGWSVVATQNRDEIMAPAYAIRNFIMVSGFFFILIAVSVVVFMSRTISIPIQTTLTTLHQAVEQSVESIAIIGLDRRVEYVNPAMEKIFGISSSAFIGQQPLLANTAGVSPDTIWETLSGGSTWSGCITGEKHKVVFSIEVSITPIRDETGHIHSFLQIGRDITRELQLEAQLRQVQKMEAIGTLAGGIAHDFNNILSGILGYTELVSRSIDEKTETFLYVQEILYGITRARNLVSQIMAFSRQSEQELRPISPKYILKEALKFLRASLPSTIEINEHIESESYIIGEATQLHQIIMNLCTNAGYAMREHGGTLSIELTDIDIDSDFSNIHPDAAVGQNIKLSITDTGCGMPPRVLEHIFDPFFTTKPVGEGTGLGLSVVHGIVKKFGGIITVNSEEGRGTSFSIYIPVTVLMSPPTQADIPGISGGTERIMMIDDEPSIIGIGKLHLEKLGYTVHGFTDSRTALESFQKNPDDYDIVITDYTMPHITGYDLTKELHKIKPDIPIIICSGYFSTEMENNAKSAGIFMLLKKPVDIGEYTHAIREAVAHKEHA